MHYIMPLKILICFYFVFCTHMPDILSIECNSSSKLFNQIQRFPKAVLLIVEKMCSISLNLTNNLNANIRNMNKYLLCILQSVAWGDTRSEQKRRNRTETRQVIRTFSSNFQRPQCIDNETYRNCLHKVKLTVTYLITHIIPSSVTFYCTFCNLRSSKRYSLFINVPQLVTLLPQIRII